MHRTLSAATPTSTPPAIRRGEDGLYPRDYLTVVPAAPSPRAISAASR